MQHRAARLTLMVLFAVALGAAAYLFWRADTEISSQQAAARAFDGASRATARAILDIRVAQQAYVASGQNGDFWIPKASEGLQALPASLAALRDQAISPDAKAALDATKSKLEHLARTDRRALDHIGANQRLLATDVVYGTGMDLGDAALSGVEAARTAELSARDAAIETLKPRQTFALVAGIAAALLTTLLLLPVPDRHAIAVPAAPAAPVATTRDREVAVSALLSTPLNGAPELKEGWSRPAKVGIAAEPERAVEVSGDAVRAHGSTTPPELTPAPDFAGVASLCTDLARVVDTRALPALLDRAAILLDASGIILWIADPDGRELSAILAQGYPPQLVNRLGTIPRDAMNATAAAFRTGLLQTVPADDISDGAIVAPLVTPGGCVGVMAAEVRRDTESRDATLAAAAIVAAQLATLVGPPSTRGSNRVEATGS